MDCNRLSMSILAGVGWTCLWISLANDAIALPAGGVQVSGNIIIGRPSDSPNLLTINQISENGIINWQNFNTTPGQVVIFNQPSSSAITLNRVLDGNPTLYAGTLLANGNIWIVNRAGIVFAKGSQVDVGGLLLTTSDIDNDHFMAGRFPYHFNQSSDQPPAAIIIEEGSQINVREGGIACLVAPAVHHRGIIHATYGKVNLGSGTAFDFYGDGLIHFVPNAVPIKTKTISYDGAELEDAISISKTGKVSAPGGKIWLTTSDAKQVVTHLINIDGVVEAKTATLKNGEIFLQGASDGIVRINGRLEAKGLNSGEKGGDIVVTGKKVGLFGSSIIDASGMQGGGSILLGGAGSRKGDVFLVEKGNRKEGLPKADRSYVASEATLTADGLGHRSKGGEIIVDSSHFTRFQGRASAKGGAEGKGGFIETSGGRLEYVQTQLINGLEVLRINPGIGGEWLIDPLNIIIQAFSENEGITVIAGDPQVWQPNGLVEPAIVNVTDLRQALSAGISVTISTDVAGTDQGTITWMSTELPVASSEPVTLTLKANSDITIEGFINIDDISGNLSLNIQTPATFNSPPGAFIRVAALSISGPTAFHMGNGNPEMSPNAFVAGDPTGSNIQIAPVPFPGLPAGSYTFNGNNLVVPVLPKPVPPTPSVPLSPPVTTIIEVLSPTSFTPPPSNSTKEPPPPITASETSPPAASPPATPPVTPSIEISPSLPSVELSAPPGIPTTVLETPTPAVSGEEQINSVEGAMGAEGVAEGSFDIEGIETTEQVAPSCDCYANKSNPEECSADPINHQCLNENQGPVSPSEFAKVVRDKAGPVGPEGVAGIDVPLGAAGIGLFRDQEAITSIIGAEGREGVVEGLAEFSDQDIDRSYEYLENLGPIRPLKQKSAIFSSILNGLPFLKKSTK